MIILASLPLSLHGAIAERFATVDTMVVLLPKCNFSKIFILTF